MKQKKQADTVRKSRQSRRAALEVLAALPIFLSGFLWILLLAVPARAAAGTVYTCTINRCYAHPVTGEIEDSGGEASYATGQGMVEGAVFSSGLLEVTEGGEYYLTFRISLVDFTSNHGFSVQNVGDSGWSPVTPAVTANGSDNNGTTSDLCILVPSENCIVRGSMYVTPMGRDVVFYFYPNNYTEGNTVGMTAAMVTEIAGSTGEAADSGQIDESGGIQTGMDETRQTNTGGNDESESDEIDQTDAGESSQADTVQTGQANTDEIRQLESSLDQVSPAAPSDTELNNVQGLRLSTASETQGDTESQDSQENGSGTGLDIVRLIAAVTVSITLSGLILMAVAAVIVCYFRKNWRRWGGYEAAGDDEDEEDKD